MCVTCLESVSLGLGCGLWKEGGETGRTFLFSFEWKWPRGSPCPHR